MTLNDLNKILATAEEQKRENIFAFAFALMDWMGITPSSTEKPPLLSPATQKLKEAMVPAPKTVQPQLYRLSHDNQNIKVRLAVLKKIKKENLSLLVDNDPGLTSFQASMRGIINIPGRTPYIASEPYFIHFITTADYNKLVVVVNLGDQKRIIHFKNRLSNTQYHKLLPQWQNIGLKTKPEISDIIWKSLDVKEVNKEFYKLIKERFDAAIGIAKTQFPEAIDKDIKQFAVRLIGRYIFCWFLKEKGIIPSQLISSKTIEENKTNFFQKYLFRLYFDTLNEEVQSRTIIKSHSLDELYFNIPYLNGGLFEKHPDDILFEKLDLNEWLVAFVKILEGFDFTVDESNSQYQQVAIDPEMLGRIFENLLASQNEETEKLANQRKAFGAFYTPREIVDYMVNESLKTYIETKLIPQKIMDTPAYVEEPLVAYKGSLFAHLEPQQTLINLEATTKNIDEERKIERLKEKIEKLFSKDCNDNPFDKTETPEVRRALSEVKIIDPACGSGAFPMGVLLRLMELRQIVGHGHKNNYELKNEILSKNIYGVDIMPMAVEIARLRAWLSLVLDSDYKPADRKNNFGISALPNLDFKFVCANSLIDSGYDAFLKQIHHNTKLKQLNDEIQKLEYIRDTYFDPKGDKQKKQELQKQFADTKNYIKKEFTGISKNWKLDDFLFKVDDWNPIDDNHPSSFFSPAWMFGIKDGFDVVIGNPPYKILTKNNTEEKILSAYINNFNSIKKANSKNIFTIMIELGANILNSNGCLTYIVPEGLFETRSYEECKQHLYSNGNVNLVVSFGHFVFENAITGNIIFQFNKQFKGVQKRLFFTPEFKLQTLEKIKDKVIEKINGQKTKPLNKVASLYKGMAVRDRETVVGEAKQFGNDIFLLGKSISNFKITKQFHTNYSNLTIDGGTKKLSQYKIVPRILVRRTGNTLCSSYLDYFALTESTLYSVWSIDRYYSNYYLLALLNSKLLTYFVQKSMLTNKQAYPQILMTDLELLPIKITDKQNQIEKLVDEILKMKKSNQDTTSLEKEIDLIVYKLYELTYDEVKIIDKDFEMSEGEYLKYEIK